jgi:transcription elongation factor S-II
MTWISLLEKRTLPSGLVSKNVPGARKEFCFLFSECRNKFLPAVAHGTEGPDVIQTINFLLVMNLLSPFVAFNRHVTSPDTFSTISQVDTILSTLKKLETVKATFELLSVRFSLSSHHPSHKKFKIHVLTVLLHLIQSTQIGKTVAKLQKLDNSTISSLSKTICDNWRNQVSIEQTKKRKRSDLNDSTASAKEPESSSATEPGSVSEPDSKRAKLESGATTPLSQSSGSISQLGSTKSDMRNKIQGRFNDALKKALETYPSEKQTGLLNPEDIAISIEEAMFKNNGADVNNLKEYGVQYQTLIMRINDVNNQWLRDAILSGALSAIDLVKLTPTELASPDQREKMRQMQEEIMAKKKIEKKKATSTAFTCKKCHQSLVHYFQLQTRSADEPMTTFIECINCGNSWKM